MSPSQASSGSQSAALEAGGRNGGYSAPRADGRGPAGSLAEMVQTERTVGLSESLPSETLIKIGILAVLMVLLQHRQIVWLFKKFGDPNWTHGFIIPLFSIYLLYMRRNELFAARRKVCLWGLVMMVLCLLGEILGFFPIQNYWFSQLCMIGMVFGLVWYLGGSGIIRVAWLPIVFLVFAVPLPGMLYSRIAVPLQNLAARGAVAILGLLGVQISSTASALDVFSRSGIKHGLTVAEACSGMRLLMAFVALGVAMAYLDEKPVWQRLILVAAAVPIAIFCNVIRVAITCWMYYIDKPTLGQNFMHHFTGLLMLAPAFGLLWLLAWILRHIVVEEEGA